MPPPIRLVVGLGNPGPAYADTRHNAGVWWLEWLARRHGGTFKADAKFHGQVCRVRIDDRECWLLKPSTYMNRSGRSVASFVHYYKLPLEQILVAHDELDLPAGAVRLKAGGGHAGHNGLRDIIAAVGGREFWRLRIGIGHPGDSREVVDYVLRKPTREDADHIEHAIAAAADAMPEVLDGEFQRAMNRLHVTR